MLINKKKTDVFDAPKVTNHKIFEPSRNISSLPVHVQDALETTVQITQNIEINLDIKY